jgi:hypothetical protein
MGARDAPANENGVLFVGALFAAAIVSCCCERVMVSRVRAFASFSATRFSECALEPLLARRTLRHVDVDGPSSTESVVASVGPTCQSMIGDQGW